MNQPGRPMARRQRWWLGVAGLAGSAALAVSSGLLVELAADWLTTQQRAVWVVGALVVAIVAVAAWRLYRSLPPRPPPGSPATTGRLAEAAEQVEVRPAALPADISGFVGRGDQLAEISERARQESAIAAVGQRGVGTSAFVLRAGHLLRDRFGDGQVYVDVRGSERRPLGPEQVLGRVCRMLGLPAPRSKRSRDLDAAGDMLRSWLARRRVLLVLDNVDDPEQVRRLLPNSAHSLALLAGTPDLKRLGATDCVDIAEPSTDEAVELLARSATRELVNADRQSAENLARLCGRQPLAMRLLGQQLLDHGWTVDELRRALESTASQPRYEQEPDGSATLRALWDTCDVAYQRLAPVQQRMFRLLGLVPATEIGVSAAAALAGLRPVRAEQALANLVRLGLLESATPGRYRLRKLLAASARLHLDSSGTAARHQRALLRLARYLAQVATDHARALTQAVRGSAAEQEAARAQAREWFAGEQDLLHRLVTNWYPATDDANDPADQPPGSLQPWLHQTAVALCVWYAGEHRLTEWHEVCQAVLGMRLADRDRAVASWAYNEIGAVHRQQGDSGAACDALTEAARRRPYRRRAQRAQVEANLGLAQLDRRDVRAAMRHFENARRLRDDRYGRAVDDLGLSGVYLQVHEPDAAQHHIERCLDTFADLGESRGLAAALNNLGLALWRRGDHTGAEEHWELALDLYTELDDTAGVARVRLNLAAMLLAIHPGRVEEAVDLLLESLRLRAASPATVGTGLCHLHLGDAYAQQGDIFRARAGWRRAREIFNDLGVPAEWEEAIRRLEQHPPDEHDANSPRMPPSEAPAPTAATPGPASAPWGSPADVVRDRLRRLAGWLGRGSSRDADRNP